MTSNEASPQTAECRARDAAVRTFVTRSGAAYAAPAKTAFQAENLPHSHRHRLEKMSSRSEPGLPCHPVLEASGAAAAVARVGSDVEESAPRRSHGAEHVVGRDAVHLHLRLVQAGDTVTLEIAPGDNDGPRHPALEVREDGHRLAGQRVPGISIGADDV